VGTLGTECAIWEKVLESLQDRLSEQRYNLWFKNTRPVALQETILTVGVPNLFVREWLEEHYLDDLERLLGQISGKGLTVKFVIDGKLLQEMRKESLSQQGELLDEIFPASRRKKSRPSGLKSDLTLGNFVVGPCNELAHAAARKVIRSPGTIYNPLFIHGPVGIGKTHLLQGICHAVNQSKRNLKAAYISSEAFANQFVRGLQTRTLDAFRHKFRDVDVLIIDDIHFLANKRATQEEFLHTFNSLDKTDKQIVMASDSHPKMIDKLKAGLINRFVSGMIIKLEQPDYQTRINILRHKLARKKKNLPQEVVEFIAKNISESVRELEGAVNILVAYAALAKSRINVNVASSLLEGMISRETRVIGINKIEKVVSDHFRVSIQDLHSKKRSRDISYPRQVCMYLARSIANLSYNEIARHFGGKNHSAAISAFKRISNDIKTDGKTIKLLSELEDKIHTQRKN